MLENADGIDACVASTDLAKQLEEWLAVAEVGYGIGGVHSDCVESIPACDSVRIAATSWADRRRFFRWLAGASLTYLGCGGVFPARPTIHRRATTAHSTPSLACGGSVSGCGGWR